VFTNPIAVVDHVVVGEGALCGEIDVTSIAVTQRPLVTMLMAAETRGHLRKHSVGSRLRDLPMAVNAIALRRERVPRVCEAELRARELDGLSDVWFAVAALTGSLVVRLLVATPAGGIRGEVQRSTLPRHVDAHVAFDAIDPLENVRSVLERSRGRLMSDAEDARARGQ
jgi:hypothetical protein